MRHDACMEILFDIIDVVSRPKHHEISMQMHESSGGDYL